MSACSNRGWIGDDVVVDHIGFGFDCAGTKLLAFNVTLISRIHVKERSPGVDEWIKSIVLNFSAKISFVLFGFALGCKSALYLLRGFFCLHNHRQCRWRQKALAMRRKKYLL